MYIRQEVLANIQSPQLTSLEYIACKYEPWHCAYVQGILKSN